MHLLLVLLRNFGHIHKIKFYFKLPKKDKILIYDRERLFFLDKIVKKRDIHVLDVRLESLNVPILLLSILKKGFKKLTKEYIKNYILAVDPKLILTFSDYNPTFYKLKDLVPECKFKTIAVQSSLRMKFHFSSFSGNTKQYKCDYCFVFSQEFKKLFSKYIQSKYYLTGSFKNNSESFKNNSEKKNNYKSKKKQILLISQFKIPDFAKKSTYFFYEKKLIEFLLKYCVKNNFLFKIAVKSNVAKEKLDFNSCANVYLKYFKNVRINNLVGETKQINNYFHVDNSDLIIFRNSTLGFEAMVRGKKILAFPPHTPLLCKNQFKEFFIAKLSTYKLFEKKLDQINSSSIKIWRKKIEKSKLKYCFDYNNSKFRNLLSKFVN